MRRATRRFILLRALACACLASTVTSSTTPAVAEDVARREAQARFKEGVDAYKKQDYETARNKFTQAYAVLKSADILINLALAELRSDRPLEALTHFREYENHPKADPASLKSLPSFIADAYKKTGHIKIDAPQGVAISIDGAAVLRPAGDVIDVLPGKHVVQAKMPDGEKRVEIDAPAGDFTIARFDAVVAPPASPPAPSATTAPPATSASASAPPAPDQPASAPFWTTRRYIGIAVAGAGVLSLATGGYFGLQSHSDADRAATAGAGLGPSGCANPANAGCADVKNAQDAQSRDNTLSTVFIGVGATALVTGVVLFLWPQSKSSTTTAIIPVVSAQGGALQLRGDF